MDNVHKTGQKPPLKTAPDRSMQTNDDPQTVVLECRPTEFEQARDLLEARGYALERCETRPGKLVLHGTRKACSCDLCRPSEGGA